MKIPRWILVVAVFGLLAITGAFAGVRIYQKHARRSAFHQKIESLMQQASKLAAMTSQGVSINDFRSQLASVHAEYDLLKTPWAEGQWPAGYESFSTAVRNWDLVLVFWKKDLQLNERSYHVSTDPDLLSFYISNDPKLRAIVVNPGKMEVATVSARRTTWERSEDQQGVNLSLALRTFMGDASEVFDESKKAMQRAP